MTTLDAPVEGINLADMDDDELRALIGVARRELARRAGESAPPPPGRGTQIRENFRAEVYLASGLEGDHRWTNWVKWVDRVDKTKATGYAFEGRFVPEGTVEIRLGRPRLLLVCRASGSRAHQRTAYAVVKLASDGTLERTSIETDSATNGWALRIRDQIAYDLALLARET